MTVGAWQDPIFKDACYLILGFLFLVAAIMFPFRNKSGNTKSAWASLISWVFAAPVLFLLLGLGSNYPLVGFVFLSIWCVKEFFQLTGMFHRSDFVWTTYIAIIMLGTCIHNQWFTTYNLLPMILLGAISLYPIIENNAKNMIQYTALTTIGFSLIGWGFLHLALITQWQHGARYLIYLIILTEICDNTALAVSKLWGKHKIVDKISPRRTKEGSIVSVLITIALAWSLRHILPNRETPFWLTSGIIAALVGSLGDLVLSVIRRDIGVKDVGAFILGRGGVLDRIDRLIFVAPIYYYALSYLQKIYPG